MERRSPLPLLAAAAMKEQLEQVEEEIGVGALTPARWSGRCSTGAGFPRARNSAVSPFAPPSLHICVEVNRTVGQIHGPNRPNLSRVDPCVFFGRRGEHDILTKV